MKAVKFPFQFDSKRMKEELDSISGSFVPLNPAKIEESCLYGMNLIHQIPPHIEKVGKDNFITTKELDQCPYLRYVLDFFECDKFLLRVHDLRSGGKIFPHRDFSSGLDCKLVRLQFPVSTHDDVHFKVGGEIVHMKNGECWLVDVTQVHEVENRGEQDRLQLMMDCDLNEWWEEILKEQGVKIKPDSEHEGKSLDELLSMKEMLSNNSDEASKSIVSNIDAELKRRQN